VQRPGRAVVVEAVEGNIFNYPIGDISHVLVDDDEVASRASATTHCGSVPLVLARGVLVESRRDTRPDLTTKVW
jgi:hypothetical protein